MSSVNPNLIMADCVEIVTSGQLKVSLVTVSAQIVHIVVVLHCVVTRHHTRYYGVCVHVHIS